jgi:DNA-binding CsgD family transcriptional regulator
VGNRFSPREESSLRDIAETLAVLRAGEDAVADSLHPIRELLQTERMLVVSPIVSDSGLDCERFHTSGMPNCDLVEQLFTKVFAKSPPRYAWYDASHPESWQRNRVIDARDLMSDDEFASNALYLECLEPTGLHRQRQPRVLLCEGNSLLGWFGSFHDGRVEPRHRTLLRRLIAPMRRRLSIDRRLAAARRKHEALEGALDEIGAPTMIVGRDGRIHESNAAARALADVGQRELAASVVDAIAKRPSAIGMDLVPVERVGVLHGWIAIARGCRDQRLRACLNAASERWGLSRRQGEILDAVVRGESNLAIASRLGVTQRAVELQVSGLLARADVESRSGLVAAVLGTFG